MTILWVELAEGEKESLEQASVSAQATAFCVARDRLAQEVFAAAALGGVVVVARAPREASAALGMGADEVIRAGEISTRNVLDAIERARARAAARLSREVHRAAHDDMEPALSELVAGLEQQLSGRLDQAALDMELLATALPALLQMGDELVATAAARPSSEELKMLAARRLTLPHSAKLREALSQIRESLQGAEGTSLVMRGLASSAGPVDRIVAETIDLLRPKLPEGIEVNLQHGPPCHVEHVPALTVALAVATLLARATEALRESGVGRAIIHVRVVEHDEAVVLEVEDQAGGMDGDLRPSLFEAYLTTAPSPRTRLVRMRERIRRCGGDSVVDSDGASTIVRVFFPRSGLELTPKSEDAAERSFPGGAPRT